MLNLYSRFPNVIILTTSNVTGAIDLAFVDRCNTLLLVVDQGLAGWENTVLIAYGNEKPPKAYVFIETLVIESASCPLIAHP